MKKLLVIIAITFIGCSKEVEKPHCYSCETTITQYRTPWIAGYPKKSTDKYESCTDETKSKAFDSGSIQASYKTIINTKCTQK